MTASLRINAKRIRKDLEDLAKIGKTPDGGVHRPVFSPDERRARKWLIARLKAAGLKTRLDGAGNIFGRLEVPGKSGAAVLAGSHIDTVPNGGRFDGALGVLSVLEALRTIRESGAAIRHPVEVVAFTDEEGRFGGFLGSKAFTGDLTKQEIGAARDPRGVRLADAMKKAGFPPAAALKARAKPSAYRGYVELHVEQGLVLEESGAEVGVVTGIVGLWKFEVAFHGRPDHAGTTPFPLRKDAYLGAADFGAGLRKLVRKHGSPITVATVGYIELSPGASNIVPETARFTVDLRDLSMPVLGRMRKAIRENLREIARKHGLKVTMEQTLEAKSVKMSAKVRGALRRASERVDARWRDMHSGAGHDAQVLGKFTPAGLYFIPSVGGRSHCPDELSRWKDIETGTNVMLHTLLELAGAGGQVKHSKR
ncbi:MAG TPA: Zn-dependent hydrolase [Nitrospinota bacterium]|jgi:N-carbamoyl-L-amino-acid hydrolase|nr:Zn-dependent hydrolase [Nitrospinota bacterium]